METNTVKELRAIAKERRLRGYSLLRKAELITMLNQQSESCYGKQSLLDEPVPNIDKVPVLQPTNPTLLGRVKQSFNVLGNKIKSETNTFADWLISYVPEPMKKEVNTKVEALKAHVNFIFNKFYKNKPVIKETKRAIKGFAKQHVVDGIAETDAVTFLNLGKGRSCKFYR
jgi:hypothetical protein